MNNIRFFNTSPEKLKEKLKKYLDQKKEARKQLMTKGVINLEDFKDLFEKSFTQGMIQVVGTSREELSKYLGLSESNAEDWEKYIDN